VPARWWAVMRQVVDSVAERQGGCCLGCRHRQLDTPVRAERDTAIRCRELNRTVPEPDLGRTCIRALLSVKSTGEPPAPHT
jgi:hypothetical protein